MYEGYMYEEGGYMYEGYMYEEGGYMYEGYMYGKGGIRKMYWLHVHTRESLLKQYTGMCPHWLVVVVSTNHL